MRSSAPQRARIVADGVEDLLVGVDRLVVVLDLVLVELTDLELDLGALVAVEGEIELLLVDVEEVLVALLAQVQALERVDRALVGLVDLEDPRGWSRARGRSRRARSPAPARPRPSAAARRTGRRTWRTTPDTPSTSSAHALVSRGQALELGADPRRAVVLGVRLELPAEGRALVAQLLLVVLGEALDALEAQLGRLRSCSSWISSTRTSLRGSRPSS